MRKEKVRAERLSDIAISYLGDGIHDLESVQSQLPCDVIPYCVLDVVVMPDGQLVNKDYLILTPSPKI